MPATGRWGALIHRAEAEPSRHAAFAGWCEYARHMTLDPPPEVRGGLAEPADDPAVERLLLLRRATLGERKAIHGLEPDGAILTGANNVAILAGPAATMSPAAKADLLSLLKPALRGCDTAILSGGTGVGVSGVVGAVAQAYGLRLVGYTPPRRADPSLYKSVRETPDALYGVRAKPEANDTGEAFRSAAELRDFSIREPLSMWTDILRAGIQPDRVSVVVFGGGSIATQELLLGWALGARVAWLDLPGAGTVRLNDTLSFRDECIPRLPADPMTVRAFITRSRLPDELRERVARYLHNDYRRKQSDRKPPDDPALAPWEQLPDTLKRSNRAEADDIPNKLALVGKRLAAPGVRLELTEREIELLAEAEHGRWTVERLSAGWKLGARDVDHRLSRDLKPWVELSDDHKKYDREAVLNIDPALARAGWGVEPM